MELLFNNYFLIKYKILPNDREETLRFNWLIYNTPQFLFL